MYYFYFIISSKVQLAIRVGVLFLRERLQQAVIRFVTPAPLRNPHPAGTVKGCRGAARDIMALGLADHNSLMADGVGY